MWKSREDKEPPAQFFAHVVAYLKMAFPGAALTHDAMQQLRPHLIEAWRNGQSAAGAARTTCSCDGQKIEPSPASALALPKKIVRPPKGALRGQAFGLEEIRPVKTVADLQWALRVAQQQVQHYQGVADGLRVQLAQKPNKKLQDRLEESLQELTLYQGEVTTLGQKLAETEAAVGYRHPLPQTPIAKRPRRRKTKPTEKPAKPKKPKKPAKEPQAKPKKSATAPSQEKRKPGGPKKAPCEDCKKKPKAAIPVKDSPPPDIEQLINEFAASQVEGKGK